MVQSGHLFLPYTHMFWWLWWWWAASGFNNEPIDIQIMACKNNTEREALWIMNNEPQQLQQHQQRRRGKKLLNVESMYWLEFSWNHKHKLFCCIIKYFAQRSNIAKIGRTRRLHYCDAMPLCVSLARGQIFPSLCGATDWWNTIEKLFFNNEKHKRGVLVMQLLEWSMHSGNEWEIHHCAGGGGGWSQ